MTAFQARWQGASLKGKLRVASDKSISHRAFILAGMSQGQSVLHQVLEAADVQRTKEALCQKGVQIKKKGAVYYVQGCPHWQEQTQQFYLGNAGTAARLLSGAFASCHTPQFFSGDSSLSQRPMKRIIEPLQQMGVHFQTEGSHLPFSFYSDHLQALQYTLPVASAQVKSALILAALQAEGTSQIIEPIPTRNHTEKMLPLFGGEITIEKQNLSVMGGQHLQATEYTVPADMSSAAFFIAGSILSPRSDLYLTGLEANETRDGFVRVLQRMQANIQYIREKDGSVSLHCQYSPQLVGTTLTAEEIPTLIDELPLFALVASQAEGSSQVQGAEELQYKESNRLLCTAHLLNQLGANIEVTADGWHITGGTPLNGGQVQSYGDHRLAMLALVAALITKESVTLEGVRDVAISYPDFLTALQQIIVL